ncbi:hypothetical protein [Candidatus Albibeggiatoa sp. nov. NOAA]|uniref:hypothetical protein n=1 Tax=Candidatus Albibeggiatoa sp. nov. NOAA TaxID=3162724 RepID=UPI0032F39CF2|nr:hypothetical protein [Thiotrichaceae bacterium]
MKKHILFGMLCGLLASNVHAIDVDVTNLDLWDIRGRPDINNGQPNVSIQEVAGRQALVLNAALALVKDSQFTHGTMEMDVLISLGKGEGQGREFGGFIWHAQDFSEFELVQYRNIQSGNPYAIHYYPYFSGKATLQLYYGDGHTGSMELTYDEWTPMKVVVAGDQAEIYLTDMETPVIFVDDLKHNGAGDNGQIGIFGNFGIEDTTTAFSNFRYEATDTPPVLKGTPHEFTPNPNIVPIWSVSNVFSSDDIAGKTVLTEADRANYTWQPLRTDEGRDNGIADFSKLHRTLPGLNTAIAKTIIRSDREQVKAFSFGFSDNVQLYFNGKLLYSASDIFGARDYAFIGTPGLFDTVYLPLREGDNELWLAVTDVLAGWGTLGEFENFDGIQLLTEGGINFDAETHACTATYDASTTTLDVPCLSVPNALSGADNELYSVQMNVTNAETGSFGIVDDTITPVPAK